MKIFNIKLILLAVLLFIGGISADEYNLDSTQPEFLNKNISLSVDNSPIEDVIRLLAKQNGFNVSVSGEELGQVSFILNDVPLYEALNAILTPNNLSWYVRNNIVVIKDAKTLTPDEIRTVVMHLKYVSANEVKLAVSNLLSEGGKIEILKETEDDESDVIPSGIVLSDRANIVAEMLNIIENMDKPMPLINISVQLVETNLSAESAMGIDWPASYSSTLGGLVDENSELAGVGLYSLEGGSWAWGKISVDNIQLALDWMLENGNARILSDPNITTVSNKTSEIGVTTTIPIETINRFTEGAVIQDIVSFQDLEIGITLKVTARINEDDVITLKVNPIIEEIIGYTGPQDNQRPITSNRTMTTEVRVKHGETLIMGGLLKESTFETVSKLPVLGSIPVLGAIFQHKSIQTENTDLTIFITPRILEDEMADAE